MTEPIGQTEDVILSAKNHWILYLKPVFFLLFGAALAALLILAGRWLSPFHATAPFAFYAMASFTLLVAVHFAFILFFEIIISKVIVTTKRVIEIRYKPFVIDDIDHAEIDRVNEVEKVKHGLFKNIFNYGSIHMSIPGKTDYFRITDIKKPSKLANLIEAIKFQKPLQELDLKGMISEITPRYAFLNRKRVTSAPASAPRN